MKTEAILIHRQEYRESSYLLRWCSAEFGIISAVARGAQRPKSPMRNRLDLLYHHELTLSLSQKSDLHTLREAHVLHYPSSQALQWLSLTTAVYFCKLIELTVEKDTPIPEHYTLLKKALLYLDSTAPTAALITRFEDKLCHLLGLQHPHQASHLAIHQVYHRLPPQRQSLLTHLSSPKKPVK